MQVREYLAFLAARAIKTAITKNCCWQQFGSVGYVTAPEGFPVHVEATDIRQMFWNKGGLFLRVIEPENEIQAKHELWHRYVCTKPYALSSLSTKARNQTRRGLERCLVRQISFEQLAQEGLPATLDTHKRHALSVEMSEEEIRTWQRSIKAYGQCPDIRAYGAFVKDLDYRLSAYVIVILVEDCWFISVHRSTSESRPFYANNALVFSVTQDLLAHAEGSMVFYGLESVEENPGLKHFKVSMGYRLQPVRQRILFHPLIRPIINRPVLSSLIRISNYVQKVRLMDNSTLRRAAQLYKWLYPPG